MSRLGSVFGLGVLAIVFLAGSVPAEAITCTYESCMAACQKLSGGGRQGGCTTWCDRTIRERKQSGVCKAK